MQDVELAMGVEGRMRGDGTGRFLEIDVHQGEVRDPESLNKYIYAENDPVGKIDPTGHDAIGELTVQADLTGTIGASSQPSTQPATPPSNTPAQVASISPVLNIVIAPVLLVAKGEATARSDARIPLLLQQLADVQLYWKTHAAINIVWSPVIVDNSGEME